MATAAERRAQRKKLAAEEGKHQVKETVNEAAAPVPAPEDRAPSATRSRNTVTVGCKVPNGLILQNHVMEDGFEPVFGGGSRPIKKARPVGNPIKIAGPSRVSGSDPDAKRVIGGYGITYNVPKDDFELWMRDNATLEIVQLGLIFAHENSDRAQDQARDQKAHRTGLEPLNVESRKANGAYVDARMPAKVKKFKADDQSSDIVGA